MAVTQKAIARAAGVSAATVNFVLNGRAAEMKIGGATVRRVRKAAEGLGYLGNYHARSLSVGRSFTIGLLARPPESDPFWDRFSGPMVAGVGRRARERGHDLLMVGSRDGHDAQYWGAQYLEQRRIDGLLSLTGFPGPASAAERGRAVVLIGTGAPSAYARVGFDAAAGIETAVAHLAKLKHTGVLFLGRRGGRAPVVHERLEAFRASARTHGIDAHEWFVPMKEPHPTEVEWYIEHYRAHLEADWQLPDKVTAVLCYNDSMALALYAVLAERGLKVPDDVSVVGFDDVQAAHAIPAMTTISHMYPEMGAKAVDIVLDVVEGKRTAKEMAGHVELVPAKLVVRQSTAKAPRR